MTIIKKTVLTVIMLGRMHICFGTDADLERAKQPHVGAQHPPALVTTTYALYQLSCMETGYWPRPDYLTQDHVPQLYLFYMNLIDWQHGERSIPYSDWQIGERIIPSSSTDVERARCAMVFLLRAILKRSPSQANQAEDFLATLVNPDSDGRSTIELCLACAERILVEEQPLSCFGKPEQIPTLVAIMRSLLGLSSPEGVAPATMEDQFRILLVSVPQYFAAWIQ